MLTADELDVLLQEPRRVIPLTPSEKLKEAKRWLEERARRHPEWKVKRLFGEHPWNGRRLFP